MLEDDLKSIKKLSIKQQHQQQQSINQHVESMEIDNGTTMVTTDIVKIKSEKLEHVENMMENTEEEKRPKKHSVPEESGDTSGSEPQPPTKVWRGLRYKTWTMGTIQPITKFKKSTDREITEVNFSKIINIQIFLEISILRNTNPPRSYSESRK